MTQWQSELTTRSETGSLIALHGRREKENEDEESDSLFLSQGESSDCPAQQRIQEEQKLGQSLQWDGEGARPQVQ